MFCAVCSQGNHFTNLEYEIISILCNHQTVNRRKGNFMVISFSQFPIPFKWKVDLKFPTGLNLYSGPRLIAGSRQRNHTNKWKFCETWNIWLEIIRVKRPPLKKWADKKYWQKNVRIKSHEKYIIIDHSKTFLPRWQTP